MSETPWRVERRVSNAALGSQPKLQKSHDLTTACSAGDKKRDLCYIQTMSDTLTVRVPVREKEAWQKLAKAIGEDLSEFARKAVRQRVQAVQAEQGSPWDDLLGSVSTDMPPATNANIRKAMRRSRLK